MISLFKNLLSKIMELFLQIKQKWKYRFDSRSLAEQMDKNGDLESNPGSL
jgi:hypothetical protein